MIARALIRCPACCAVLLWAAHSRSHAASLKVFCYPTATPLFMPLRVETTDSRCEYVDCTVQAADEEARARMREELNKAGYDVVDA